MYNRNFAIILLVLGILVNSVPRFYNLNPPREVTTYIQNGVTYYKSVICIPMDEYEVYAHNRYIFYSSQALSFLLILLAGYFKPCKDKVVDIVFELTLWLAVSNLMDELFFDPVHLGLNEIVFAILMIIYAVHQCKKQKSSDNLHTTNSG